MDTLKTDNRTRSDWITALRASAIAKPARDEWLLQMSLFGQRDLARITNSDHRRAADRLPQPGAGRAARPQTRRPAPPPRPALAQ